MPGIDTHQHLWSEPLWSALEARCRPPFIDRRAGAWTLHLPAEPACELPGPDRIDDRLALLDLDGVEAAVVAPSLALGLEWLPEPEARTLLEAQRQGVHDGGPRFERWAAVPVERPDPALLEAELADGAVGLCLGAGILDRAAGLEHVAPLLEVLARAGAPLFIHPGVPRPEALAGEARWSAEPWWWPGLTDYVAQMQRAWFLWAARGRSEFPQLRVLFAMLAGLAPLQASRLAARGAAGVAARALADPLAFYDTSSYDPATQRAVAQLVGESQLVHGSDRPVVSAVAATADDTARSTTNAHRLFGKAA